MRLEIVDLGLLEVGEIAYAERGLSAEGDVGHELMAHGRGRDEGDGDYVMVVVAAREDLVVGLSVVGAEHQAEER